MISVKSMFHAEFRRFSIDKRIQQDYRALYTMLETLHSLSGIAFVMQYIDTNDSSLLPINNEDNYARAITNAVGVAGGNVASSAHESQHNSSALLRIVLERKGESYGEQRGYGRVLQKPQPANKVIEAIASSKASGAGGGGSGGDSAFSSQSNSSSWFGGGGHHDSAAPPRIALQDDFQFISAIVDVELVPESYRRVKLTRSRNRPLGFFIRDGLSMRVNATGISRVSAIFISRLVPGGLAESTGLLAVNDEVIEVNGIEVFGKTLDQVSDMMMANSQNLTITVKPVNQSNCLRQRPSASSASSSMHAKGGARSSTGAASGSGGAATGIGGVGSGVGGSIPTGSRQSSGRTSSPSNISQYNQPAYQNHHHQQQQQQQHNLTNQNTNNNNNSNNNNNNNNGLIRL